MIYLTLDASSSSASVSLSRDDALVYECYLNSGLTHSSALMPMVEDALRHGNCDIGQVDVFGCVVGPGSFTGVRIGVATVMGLAGDKPCAPINGLEALARQAAGFHGLVCPILDARAQQVYGAAFENGARVLPDEPIKLELFLDKLRAMGKQCLFVGDGVKAYAQRLREIEFAVLGDAPQCGLHASYAALLAKEHPETWVPAKDLRPYYLRAPQAERERAQRLSKEDAACPTAP